MAVASALNMFGVIGSRPAASIAGRFYFSTDTGIVSYDNGSAWTDVVGSAARGLLGYVAVTTNQTTTAVGAGSAVDLTSLTLTVTATARKLQLGLYTDYLAHSADGGRAVIQIYDVTGTAIVGDAIVSVGGAGKGNVCKAEAIVTPGAGSRTYKGQFYAIDAGTITFSASAPSAGSAGWLSILEI